MSATGVLLAYQRQIVAWADRGYRVEGTASAVRLSAATLLDRFRAASPNDTPLTLTVKSDPMLDTWRSALADRTRGVADALDAAAPTLTVGAHPDAAAELSELAARLTPRPIPRARTGWRRPGAIGSWRATSDEHASCSSGLWEPAAERGSGRAELLFRLAVVRQLMDDFGAVRGLGREALRECGRRRGADRADQAPARGHQLHHRPRLELWRAACLRGHGAGRAGSAIRGCWRPPSAPYATWRYATGTGSTRTRRGEGRSWNRGPRHLRTLDLPEFDIANIEFLEGATASAHRAPSEPAARACRAATATIRACRSCSGTRDFGDFLEGRSDVAWERIERATRLSHATDQRTAEVHTLVCEARLEARLGNADRALDGREGAFDLMEATKWRVAEWWMRVDLALLELSRGDARGGPGASSQGRSTRRCGRAGARRWAQAGRRGSAGRARAP